MMPSAMILNLNFHGIGAPRGRDFGPGEEEFWATPETFEATLDLVAEDPGRVALSFDDGNITDVEIALPALQRRGLTAIFFIVAGWLDTLPGFITGPDVRCLAAAGMTIGNHGLQHLRWPDLDRGALHHELSEGQRRLQKLSPSAITTAALPYGAYNQHVLSTLKQDGYTHVYSSARAPAPVDPSAWLQPRTHITASDTPATVRALLG